MCCKWNCKPLSIIFYAFLSSGIFPDELKVVKAVPIYKQDRPNPQDFGNYRPVSVLPCIFKILERIVYNRTYEFLSNNHLLYKKQYGFRTDHSTYMTVIDFINAVNKAIDQNMNTVGIFMDLSKAFDTIDHDILLSKLSHYGFKGISQEWFSSFLSNRKHFFIQYWQISLCKYKMWPAPMIHTWAPPLYSLYEWYYVIRLNYLKQYYLLMIQHVFIHIKMSRFYVKQ